MITLAHIMHQYDINHVILLMEEILHQLMGSLSHYLHLFTTFYTSQVVIAGFLNHQRYVFCSSEYQRQWLQPLGPWPPAPEFRELSMVVLGNFELMALKWFIKACG